MEKIIAKHFKYNLFTPPIHSNKKGLTIIFYHGWGTTADSYNEVAEELARRGYKVVVPEIIYHDSRNALNNPFNRQVMQNYFWKTIFESIDEFSEFMKLLETPWQNTIVVGSSMGGFIANGIFASSRDLGGLVNINGSGSFLLSEKLFRKLDNRSEPSLEEELILKKYNPIEQENCNAPVLLMHGDSDRTIPIEGQKDFYKYLTEVKGRSIVDFFIYENVNHQFTEGMFNDLIIWLEKNYGSSPRLDNQHFS